MRHICVSKLTIIGSDNGLSPDQRHYLNQCWNIVNCTTGNKLQSNLKQNLYIFIQENAFENVVWKMASIVTRPQCVKNIYKNCEEIINCLMYLYNCEYDWKNKVEYLISVHIKSLRPEDGIWQPQTRISLDLIIVGSVNGLASNRHQVITWTYDNP